MSFTEALTKPRVQKYRTKMVKLLEALPGEEVDALEQMLGDESFGHTYIQRAIKGEAENHPDIDQDLFSVSDKVIAKYRDDFFDVRNSQPVSGL